MGVEPSRSELRAARERCGLKTVEALWDELLAFLKLPPDTPEVQVTEMRKAFMAGAWAAFSQVERIGGDDVPASVGAAHLEGMRADLAAFHKRLRAGHHTGRAEATP